MDKKTSQWAHVGLLMLASALLTTGCATYTTPGAGVTVAKLSQTTEDIAEAMNREATANFPSRIAVARAQSSGYFAFRSEPCFGKGRYCVVTTRDVEQDQDFERLARLPMVAGIAPVGRLVLPEQLDSIKDVRLAVAQLKTDMLLLYTLDARFIIEQRANTWSTDEALDRARVKTEADSFRKLVVELEKLWKGVVETHVAVRKKS